jgi:hypothetical protein
MQNPRIANFAAMMQTKQDNHSFWLGIMECTNQLPLFAITNPSLTLPAAPLFCRSSRSTLPDNGTS